jgi:hypothetical protein
MKIKILELNKRSVNGNYYISDEVTRMAIAKFIKQNKEGVYSEHSTPNVNDIPMHEALKRISEIKESNIVGKVHNFVFEDNKLFGEFSPNKKGKELIKQRPYLAMRSFCVSKKNDNGKVIKSLRDIVTFDMTDADPWPDTK